MRVRRLPIPVRPATGETIASYTGRLARIHGMPYNQLWQALSTPLRARGARCRLVVERLAEATGRPAAVLRQALPEVSPGVEWTALRHLNQYACPGCTAAHPGGPVRRLFAHHQFVCGWHGYWIGHPDPVTTTHRRRLSRLIPELAAAQRHHDRLVHRHGWDRVFHAVEASLDLCLTLATGPLRPTHPWPGRITRLTHRQTLPRTQYVAVFYPETIHLARLFLTGPPPDPQTIADRVHQALGDPQPLPDTQTAAAWTESGIHEWLNHLTHAQTRLSPHQTFPDTRRPTLDGTHTHLAGHRTHTGLELKARTEWRHHRRYPPWCLARNLHHTSHEPADNEPAPLARDHR